MNRPLSAVSSSLLIVSALVITACGGLYTSQEGTGDGLRDGLRFSSQNPTTATPGSTVELAYDAFASSSAEYNQTVTVGLAADNGATVSPTTTQVSLPASTTGVTRIVRVQIPANAAVGSEITVVAGRDGVRSTSYRLRIAASGLTASISPATVNAPVGGNAVGTLTLTPVGGFSGSISVVGLDPDIVVSPNPVTIPAGQTTPVTTQVTYRVRNDAVIGTPILAPVRATSGSTRAIASYTVTPTSNQGQGSFELSVSPAQVNLVGGQPSSAVTVTVTPTNGFQGDVTINVSLPGQGSLTVAPPTTNPFNVTVTNGPVTRTFNLQYQPVQGGTAPIGTATVQATANGINRTATFQVGAS